MARIFVLGATGFLGAHVVEAALAGPAGSAHQVLAASRRPARAAYVVSQPAALSELALDGLDTRDLYQALDAYQPNAVLSLAALARPADCEADPELAVAVNVELPRSLALWSRRNRGVRLVHVSSDLVFGGQPPQGLQGFTESDSPAPLNAYGRTKLAGERALLEVDPSALVVRLPLLFGPAHGRALGATASVLQAVRAGQRPALFVDELRTPLDVRDAAAALCELAQKGAGPSGLLHVAGPTRLSRFELGCLALEAAGYEPGAARELIRATRQAEIQTDAERPSDVSLDSALGRSVLHTSLRSVRAALALPQQAE